MDMTSQGWHRRPLVLCLGQTSAGSDGVDEPVGMDDEVLAAELLQLALRQDRRDHVRRPTGLVDGVMPAVLSEGITQSSSTNLPKRGIAETNKYSAK